MFVTPTVVGDLLFVGSCSGVAFAFDRASGAVRWRYDTRQDAGPAQFHGDPAVLGDLLVTGSDSAEPSFLYAFDAATGAVRWKTERDVIETDVVVAGGHLIGRTWSGELVALDPATGTRRWRLAPEDHVCGGRPHSPAARGDRVVLGGSDGAVYAVDAALGAVLWRRELGCGAGAPVVWGEDVYLGIAPDKIVRLRLADGAVVGERAVGGRPHSRLTVAGESLIALVGGQDIEAFDLDLVERRWRRTTDSDWSAFRPLPWKGGVVVGDAEGHFLLLDPRDGTVRWSAQVAGTVRGLGAHGDVLYVGTLSGTIYAIAPDLEAGPGRGSTRPQE